MAAGFHGSSEIVLQYDDGPGGTLRNVSSYVLTIGDITITSETANSTALGDTVMKKLPTGVSSYPDFTLEGLWNDTATTGAHVVFKAPDTSPQASTRSLSLNFGNSQTWSSEGYLLEYSVIGKVGDLTHFKAKGCQNSGSWA